MIGVDWGTSNCRAFHFDAGGGVIEQRTSDRGITTVADGGFEAVLEALIGDWTDGDTPILLAGMIGSRNGWLEAPYLACPAALGDIAAAAVPVATRLGEARIVPGLSYAMPGGASDVMRGEETQLIGVAGEGASLVVMPGTHSKWARLDGSTVASFRTFMTGELFAVLRQHSILGRLMEPGEGFDRAAFERGVTRALEDRAITALLFGVRTEGLFGRVAADGLADYLSGLLLGAELAAGMADAKEPATIIATPALAERYAIGFGLAGLPPPHVVEGGAASARGLWTIGERWRVRP